MKRLAFVPDAALAALVALSLVLSFQLWTRDSSWPTWAAPGESRREPRPGDAPPGDPPDVEQLLEATEIVAHLGDGRRVRVLPGTEAYAAAWRAIRASFGRGAPVETLDATAPATQRELDERRGGAALEVELPVALRVEDWALLWRADAELRPWPVTRRAMFSLRAPAQVLYWLEGERTIARSPMTSGADDVAAALDRAGEAELPAVAEAPRQVGRLRVDRGIFTPAGLELPVFEAIRPITDVSATIASYFADPSGLRRVAERDGAVIFTDGREGLRVYPSGAFEFTAALGERRAETASLFGELQSARSFVHLHGGWPAGAHLVGREIVDGRSELSFSQRLHGWPVLGPRPPLQVLLQGERVARYARFAWPGRPVGPPAPLIPATAVLQRLDDAWLAAFPWNPERRVTAIHLGYYSPAPPRSGVVDGAATALLFEPVWAITVHGGYEAFVDAITGELRR